MKLIVAKYCGFCFGVKNAVEIAERNAGDDTYTYGEIIHNERVVRRLSDAGVKVIHSLQGIESGKVIIRSHGVPRSVYREIADKGLTVIDATCPFVKKIHGIADEKSKAGYRVLIAGEPSHPEVRGVLGWCEGGRVIDENSDLSDINEDEKVCVVAQTTINPENFSNIVKKIRKLPCKTVEIFDTICYTTVKRQNEAKQLAGICDAVLVIGSRTSSNTSKLFDICALGCEHCYHIEQPADLKNIKFSPNDTVGIVAGASAPPELITEVKQYMAIEFEEVQSQEFKDAVEESLVSYKEGRRIKGTVIGADEKGIHVNIGGKKDGLIPKDEVSMDGEYRPEDFPIGSDIEAVIVSKQDAESGCILLSKKRVDEIKEGDKVVEAIRDGSIFEFEADKVTKGGLLGKLGTYTVFIPASQIREGYVKDLKPFAGKKLRLIAMEIEDEKHKIVASQREVIKKEREEREEIFWENVRPNVIVNGKVKRVTNFGAFVSVDGFDCLAHIVDLSWKHIKKVEDVLTIGENYDFLVLSVDREKKRVSLGYKQLQQHPFVACMEKHPIGSVCKGKVVSIVPFGAFVEIEPDVEGLVHVSEAAHNFVKNINEVVKVGDEIDVKILNADEANKKITLSIKACQEEDASAQEASEGSERSERSERKPARSKQRPQREADDSTQWNEDVSNNPFADLLKDLNENND